MLLQVGDGTPRIDNSEEILEYFNNNPKESLTKIAKHFNICKDSVVKILKINNINLRRNRTLCKEVCQYDKNGILLNTFETAREAAKFLGEIQLNSHINSCCNNKRKTCKGFIWKFKEETR